MDENAFENFLWKMAAIFLGLNVLNSLCEIPNVPFQLSLRYLDMLYDMFF